MTSIPMPTFALDESRADPRPEPKNKVQIALLLDTSSSMDGLISQAKSQLWKVVNTFAEAKRDGEVPYVEVALYEYGNSGLAVGNNYIRQVQPLTRDLDEVSKQLNALSTNGGEEYCGAVIQRATSDLVWDLSKNTYKAIFIAGNEPFTQGPVDARMACKESFAKGIIVNAIHCGQRETGVTGSWSDGPALAGGKFLVIDQDKAVAAINAPQDGAIAKLGVELNSTYIAYGRRAEESVSKQQSADMAATGAGQNAPVERAKTKASKNYHNSQWDMVDKVKEDKDAIANMPKEELPAAMQSMTLRQRTEYLENAAKTRAELQSKIAQLSKERDVFVAQEEAKMKGAGGKTLDEAVAETAREQAGNKGYIFAK